VRADIDEADDENQQKHEQAHIAGGRQLGHGGMG
jgi:hypothetical protein